MARTNRDKPLMHCSFCGKSQNEVRKLIAGPGVSICDECIETCNDIILEDFASEKDSFLNKDLPIPKEIKAILDNYVIEQEDAKKILSVAVYNHYKRIHLNYNRKRNKEEDLEIEKSNICLIGPTGSGKTLLARTLARILKVPFAMVDATTLTEAGYVGEDVENILLKLIHSTGEQDINQAIKSAQIGIIYIDEIDKISRKSDNPSITRDVSGEGVQQALLKIIEGTVASVPPQGGRKHPHQEYLRIDTKDILFICGGAFVGLDKIVEQRTGQKSMGFGANIKKQGEKKYSDLMKNVSPEDLLKFGLIPELIGRLPVIATLDALELSALKKILVEPKNAIIKQYQKSFEMEKTKLVVEDDAIEAIAQLSIKQNTGARGLRTILEDIMLEIMYEIPSNPDITKVVITKDVVEKKIEPIVYYKNQKSA